MSSIHPEGDWSVWPAPAKLNLFLHIVRRREDGYHDLQTVFQLLDWGDEIVLRVRGDGQVERVSGLPDVAPPADLAVRAALALKAASGSPLGVDIEVRKRIPVGGGFGGGSSDAATVLVALDKLWKTQLGEDRLASIGAGLGADVPVFVRGRSAWADGIGERLQPVELGERWYLVVDSGVCVPTAELFQAPDLTRDAPSATIADFDSGKLRGNAFEPVLRRRAPEVDRVMRRLGEHGLARLTGTGGGVFAAFDSRESAASARRALPAAWRSWVVRGIDRSPLLDR
jgi:4-diphosphocytidyl-2-C-methyl-D-erythritol kinase